MLPFVMTATYTTIYLILPFYLKKRKLVLTVFLVVVLIFFITLGERIFLRRLNSLPVTRDSIFGVTFLYLMLETNFMLAIAFAIKIVKKWFVQQNEKHEMEKQNLKSELNLLKAQLHPHFLFNTMNNLYALSLEKSTKTSEGIAKISDLLRSILYECNEAEIQLEKEITLINNYIELEKLRYDERLHLNFEVSGPLNEMKIAPMLLFTFVENCFKHGSSNDPEHPFITISINVLQNKMIFFSKNSKPAATRVKNTEGIGLNNVKKRLDLIYGSKYSLEIEDKQDTFTVSLSIQK
jgi:LytS/YehU family sensor histidine kinase